MSAEHCRRQARRRPAAILRASAPGGEADCASAGWILNQARNTIGR